MDRKINAVLMIEILGKPAEYITETLSNMVDNLSKEKNVNLVNKKIEEPKEVPDQGDIFTTFAEVEVETEIYDLMLLIFKYMPSHIDIVTPEEVRVKNSDFNIFLNELTRKLHRYDEIAKTVLLERQILAKKIKSGEIQVKKPKVEKKTKTKRKKK